MNLINFNDNFKSLINLNLKINNNGMGDEGAKRISALLSNLKSLTILSLSLVASLISAKGAKLLGEGLSNLKGLI